MTVWNPHHSKLAIFRIERKGMIFEAGFISVLKTDLLEFLCKHDVGMSDSPPNGKSSLSPCMEG